MRTRQSGASGAPPASALPPATQRLEKPATAPLRRRCDQARRDDACGVAALVPLAKKRTKRRAHQEPAQGSRRSQRQRGAATATTSAGCASIGAVQPVAAQAAAPLIPEQPVVTAPSDEKKPATQQEPAASAPSSAGSTWVSPPALLPATLVGPGRIVEMPAPEQAVPASEDDINHFLGIYSRCTAAAATSADPSDIEDEEEEENVVLQEYESAVEVERELDRLQSVAAYGSGSAAIALLADQNHWGEPAASNWSFY